MVTFQKFVIPGRLMNLNEYQNHCRANRYGGNSWKQKEQEKVELAIERHGLSPMIEPVDIKFLWVEPNMRRDKDNIRFAAKFILDALVSKGIIKNDGWRNIGNLSDTFRVNANNPRIEVIITTTYERETHETDRATGNPHSA